MRTLLSRNLEEANAPSGRRLVLALTAWVVVSAAFGFTTFAVGKSLAPEWASDPDNLAVVITAEVYALLVASLLLVVGQGKSNKTGLALMPVRGREVVMALAALGSVFAVSGLGYTIVEAVASPEPSALDLILGIGSDGGRLADAGFLSTALIMTRILVLVPLGEELLFRGALFGWIRRRLSARWTIVITSLLFAVVHQFLIILPAVFLAGVALGWARERTGSVIPGIVAHSLNGLLLMLLSLIATGWTATLPF